MRGRREGYTLEKRFIRRDEGIVHALLDVKCARDAQGRVEYLVATVADISDRVAAEGRLRAYAERLRALSRRLLDVQEDERRALARELHDEFGQTMAALKINLQSARRKIVSETAKERLGECVDIAETVISQIRERALDLRPSILDDLGLTAALEWFVARQNALGGSVYSLQLHGDPVRLNPQIEIAAFRIAQECANNARRHGSARRVDIRLKFSEDALRLEVCDDGSGFDVASAWQKSREGGGIGIPGMAERAQVLGGSLEIHSSPGEGAQVVAILATGGRSQDQSESSDPT